jgi:hypothetical protein
MITDKDTKTLIKIMRGGSFSGLFTRNIHGTNFSDNYMLATDARHMVGLPVDKLHEEELFPNITAENIDQMLAGKYLWLFTADAKEMRKALRSAKTTTKAVITVIDHIVTVHGIEETYKTGWREVVGDSVLIPTTQQNMNYQVNESYSIIKSQWMNILSLMEGPVQVNICVKENSFQFVLIENDRKRFGISMGLYDDLHKLTWFSRDLWEIVAKETFIKEHNSLKAVSTLRLNEAKLIAPTINWYPYWMHHYEPVVAAKEYIRLHYGKVPSNFKVDKILVRWFQGKKNREVHILIKRNGKVYRYVTDWNHYYKLEHILKFWGYTSDYRWKPRNNRRGSSELFLAPA